MYNQLLTADIVQYTTKERENNIVAFVTTKLPILIIIKNIQSY